MSKKKENVENEADETKNQKFKRLANVRGKKAIYELDRLTRMSTQISYEIYDVDAEKLIDSVSKSFSRFLDVYSKISKGETIKVSKEIQEDIF